MYIKLYLKLNLTLNGYTVTRHQKSLHTMYNITDGASNTNKRVLTVFVTWWGFSLEMDSKPCEFCFYTESKHGTNQLDCLQRDLRNFPVGRIFLKWMNQQTCSLVSGVFTFAWLCCAGIYFLSGLEFLMLSEGLSDILFELGTAFTMMSLCSLCG